jgi:hypothetical protein
MVKTGNDHNFKFKDGKWHFNFLFGGRYVLTYNRRHHSSNDAMLVKVENMVKPAQHERPGKRLPDYFVNKARECDN